MPNDVESIKKAKEIEKELLTRELCRRDFKAFLVEKWARYNKAVFNDNWHFDYLAKILEHTLPPAQKDSREIITRLMLNMPPSYGKTETIARSFIAWALGRDRARKFIYVSYSDDLCRKINNQVRDLIKSQFWQSIFGEKPSFIQDNANEFVFAQGGGLFVTTLKSAITGFHAHQILIDDPIKVSNMSSASERKAVNQNFKESVLSRLQDNNSNITILMQRLGDEDLCGFLLNEKNFEKEIINQWRVVKLQALNAKDETYQIGDFSYTRKANEPLFPLRHDLDDLKTLRLQMGEDEFSTQYQQEPQVSEAGFFEPSYFKLIPSYEQGEQFEYIFCDPATSLNAKADNRAIVVVGVESSSDGVWRYVLKDCLFGIWDEEHTCTELLTLMLKYPKARVYIESDGGGITLHRFLLKEIARLNIELKIKDKDLIVNSTQLYSPSRKIAKVDKIKSMKSYYNTGHLVFLNTAQGLEQLKKELFAFNPEKPYRRDDCIDALASCIAHGDVVAPYKAPQKVANLPAHRMPKKPIWRI